MAWPMSKRPPTPGSLKEFYLKAPTGGMNTVDPAGALPDGDAIWVNNLISAEYGLRSRLGYSEWATGLTGAIDSIVRTIVPFTGSHKNGTTDKLFATTSTGIWDVTNQGATPVVYAAATVYALSALVTQNGNLYACSQAGTSAPLLGGLGPNPAVAAWATGTPYFAGDSKSANGNVYTCTFSGVSSLVGTGPSGTGGAIVDGSVTWKYTLTPTGLNIPDGTVLWNFIETASSNIAPSLLVAFGTTTGDAGRGTYTAVSTAAGKFLVYCDEENGAYVYSENSTTWTQIASGVNLAWATLTLYAVGNQVINGGNTYTCTTGGTSGNGAGPVGTGAGIGDGGTSVWTGVAGVTASSIGPDLAAQNAGFTALPANFAFAVTWKSRLWFVEKNSTRGWFMPVGALYGTASQVDFGVKMKSGGPLVGLYNWSFDGGSGLDTLLVAISTAGDVVIYQGTDPTSANTFALKGTWYIPGIPYGRNVATDYGGDVLVMSLQGVIPLSKLIIGNPIIDRTQYLTYKVSNIFSQLVAQAQGTPGWQVTTHPTDNALLILAPSVVSPAVGTSIYLSQLAMSFPTKGWSQYQNLPMVCAATWHGVLYFGTADGRVCQNVGYVDNAKLFLPSSFSPVVWSVLTAYQNLSSMRNKRMRMIRPTVLTQTPSPQLVASTRLNFDMSQPPLNAFGAMTSGSAGTWDNATWDTSTWTDSYVSFQPLIGCAGVGRDVAAVIQGAAVSRTVLVGANVLFEVGGLL